jgi:hypothetical protein
MEDACREKLTFTTVDVVERQEFFPCSGCELLLIFKLTEYNYLSMYCDQINRRTAVHGEMI